MRSALETSVEIESGCLIVFLKFVLFIVSIFLVFFFWNFEVN